MPTLRTLLALSVPALLLTACPDPEGTYDEFKDRYTAIHPGTGATGGAGGAAGSSGAAGTTGDGGPDAPACVVPAPGELDGDYLFVLSAVVNPPKAILFLATITTQDSGGKTEMTWSLQALSATDRETPVGPPIALDPYVLPDNGMMDADLPPLDVVGEANPISGSPITADVSSLKGKFCDTDGFYCGTIEGDVTKPIPIPLAGSTWTMTKVTGPADYPKPPPIDCAKTPAEAL